MHPLVADEFAGDEGVASEAPYKAAALPRDGVTTKILGLLAISAGAGAMLGWIIKRRM